MKILIDTNVVLDIALNRTPGSGPPGRKHPPKEKRRETWIGFTAFLCLRGFLGLSRPHLSPTPEPRNNDTPTGQAKSRNER